MYLLTWVLIVNTDIDMFALQSTEIKLQIFQNVMAPNSSSVNFI